MCIPPLSEDVVGIVTVLVGIVAAVAAAVICHARGRGRTRVIAGAWLSYCFTVCPLLMIGFNALAMMINRAGAMCTSPGGAAPVVDAAMGAGGPTITFSAAYAIIHLTGDLYHSVKAAPPSG